MSKNKVSEELGFDTNLDNYNYEDLMTLFDVEPQHSLEDIKKKSNDYLEALENEHPNIIEFVRNAQQKLLETHNLSIEEGTKNPIKRELHYKYLCLDSRFRQNNSAVNNQSIIDPNSNEEVILTNIETANYTINLSETLKNVIRLKFDKIHIPFSWYNVYEPKNSFQVTVGANPTVIVTITPGNYVLNTSTDDNNIIQAINTNTDLPANVVFSYNPITGKVEIENTTGDDVTIEFMNAENLKCRQSLKIDNNFGTLLGFKIISYTFASGTTITSEGFPNMMRTKYVLIELNDYNKNYVANKFVHARNRDDVASLPSYYTTLTQAGPGVAITSINGICIDDETKNSGIITNNKQIPNYNESYPRSMTQNQIYSLNEIIKSRANNAAIKQEFAASPNYFASIPILSSTNLYNFGELIIYDDDTSNINERIYFGPVDIERLHVRVLDENGELLDLNGAEWSFTIIVEHLYQY